VAALVVACPLLLLTSYEAVRTVRGLVAALKSRPVAAGAFVWELSEFGLMMLRQSGSEEVGQASIPKANSRWIDLLIF
jgi:hypothetical protein